MPLTSVTKDPDALTMTMVADFGVPLQRIWDAYVDPRQIEKFWGPPTYPARFIRHDAFPGGRTSYVMTGPNGDSHAGYWEWIDVQPPAGETASFEVVDGFAHADGSPNPEMPSMRMTFAFEATAEGSRLTTKTRFKTAEELEKLLEMGAEEGTRQAMAQIDAVVADLQSFAHGRATATDILSDTKVRVSRVVRGTPEEVWRAHHEPELVRRWLLGPDGWTMPVCELAAEVGETYRYEWEPVEGGAAEGSERFGFTGELLESDPPHRAVTSERMIGMDGPSTVNELTLTPQESGTLLSMVITYPDAKVRDTVLETGMVNGMEASYARLEREVLG